MKILKPELTIGNNKHYLPTLLIMEKCLINHIDRFNKRKDVCFKSDKINEYSERLNIVRHSIGYYKQL
jgi:hypothetical protein